MDSDLTSRVRELIPMHCARRMSASHASDLHGRCPACLLAWGRCNAAAGCHCCCCCHAWRNMRSSAAPPEALSASSYQGRTCLTYEGPAACLSTARPAGGQQAESPGPDPHQLEARQRSPARPRQRSGAPLDHFHRNRAHRGHAARGAAAPAAAALWGAAPDRRRAHPHRAAARDGAWGAGGAPRRRRR